MLRSKARDQLTLDLHAAHFITAILPASSTHLLLKAVHVAGAVSQKDVVVDEKFEVRHDVDDEARSAAAGLFNLARHLSQQPVERNQLRVILKKQRTHTDEL